MTAPPASCDAIKAMHDPGGKGENSSPPSATAISSKENSHRTRPMARLAQATSASASSARWSDDGSGMRHRGGLQFGQAGAQGRPDDHLRALCGDVVNRLGNRRAKTVKIEPGDHCAGAAGVTEGAGHQHA